MGLLSSGPIPDPHVSPNSQTVVEKISFHIAAKQLEIDESINRARLVRHFLALNLCLEQSHSFHQSPKSVNADRTQYVWSSSGLITIVVMTLFLL